MDHTPITHADLTDTSICSLLVFRSEGLRFDSGRAHHEMNYAESMRRISYLSIFSFLAVAVVFTSSAPVKAETKTVYIFNTTYATNKGLGFCEPTSANGCIDSISIDGNQLTLSTSGSTADYVIAGGLYSNQCRFLDTKATPCEAPYMVIYPRGGPTANPTGSQVIGEVTINFRRQPSDEPTARVGAMISNGLVKSFTPAAPGIRDVANIVVSPTQTHEYQAPGGASCSGWVPTVDLCAIGEKATHSYSNKVVVFLLPGFRNSVVPSDEVVSNCTIDLTNNCVVNVFDPMSLGGWIDTDASIFGTASTDRLTGAAQLKIAGPHFQSQAGQIEEIRTPGTCPHIKSICDGSPANQVWPETITTVIKNLEPILNLSTVRSYIPSGYLMNSYGLTPSQVNATTLPVRRTVGTEQTIPATTYTPVAGGVQIVTTGIGFSVPIISTSRVLTVKKGTKISSTALIKAAGLYQANKLWKFTIATSKIDGVTKSGSSFVFTKKKALTLVINYKTTKKTVAKRTLQVQVG